MCKDGLSFSFIELEGHMIRFDHISVVEDFKKVKARYYSESEYIPKTTRTVIILRDSYGKLFLEASYKRVSDLVKEAIAS